MRDIRPGMAGRAAAASRRAPQKKGRGLIGTVTHGLGEAAHGVDVGANKAVDYVSNFNPLSSDLPRKRRPHAKDTRTYRRDHKGVFRDSREF